MEKKSNNTIYYILYPVVFLLGIALDRYTKYLAVKNLSGGRIINVIGEIFQFTYLENRGAAFGMLQGKQTFFFLITIMVCMFIVFVLIKCPKNSYYMPFSLTLTFILSGAVGNFIDRAAQDYVVDFIYFSPINFPVFNVADIFVTLGCIALIILILFVYKDEDFDFITKIKMKKDDTDSK